ncbi:lactonase family protein [Prevotella dentasini]|uniref:lactonase family protein n=1 Tax=Prevotella dentasini TaxID=589537 RepID=UPI0004687B6F|nr:lactonase family protein [Prevotella dentasini]
MKTKSILLGLCALAATCVQAGNPLKMAVGTYTDTNSRGIYSFDFDQKTGKATSLGVLDLKNPSYLTFSKDGKYIYAVSETNDKKASINCISFNQKDGKMKLLNTQPTNGEAPCYVEADERMAITANYSGGSMSIFPILPDGTLDKCQRLFGGHTGGPDQTRQNRPHIHCVKLTPDGYIFATDFSADQILRFKYSKESGYIYIDEAPIAAKIGKDSGPRHLTFSPEGKHAYLMNELSGRVTVFDHADGRLTEIQSVPTNNAKSRGGADIHVSPDGKFLYASNCLKADGIAIFKIDKETGKLTKTGYQTTGTHPRNFAITPNGKFLLVACRDSNKIQVFSRNPETGLLSDTHQDIKLSKPACIQFG